MWVFKPLTVRIPPHLVAIFDETGAGKTAAPGLAAAFRVIEAIWQRCGVRFDVREPIGEVVTPADDLWSRRSLMYPTTAAIGALNPLKDLPGSKTDADGLAARRTIASPDFYGRAAPRPLAAEGFTGA